MNPLKALAQQGDISHLSYYFAEFIAEQAEQPMDSLLAFSVALVSEANQQGDVCIMLERYAGERFFDGDSAMLAPDCETWREQLSAFDCVGVVGQLAPLILEDNRLYLYRFWFYESQLAELINQRLVDTEEIDTSGLRQQLHRLYPITADETINEQKLAVALSARRRFAVISGGPGTGKTTTVINILAVLLAQQPSMRIRLAAPTGKAAARMMESIRRNIENSNLDGDSKALIPTQAGTIHRLLGYSQNGFRYSRQHRLPVDCIVIDEASMVDLTLMYRLIDALPDKARVILLGDRDQLASVAAGNILGDITGQGQAIAYSPHQTESLSSILEQKVAPSTGAVPAISDSIALLTQSYRFDAQSDIGQLAHSINRGDSRAAIDLLGAPQSEINWHSNEEDRPLKSTFDAILSAYHAVPGAESVEEAFDIFESRRVLCAVHAGKFGVEAINRQITELLRTQYEIDGDENFRGKPILISANDYELELFNGDIGILWHDENQNLRAYFRDVDQGLRSLAVTSLPAHETAWAMTVHKSQGSEFDSVILILPSETQVRALSRELLYTAVTRARKKLRIDARRSILEMACKTRSQRHSGLARKLGWP